MCIQTVFLLFVLPFSFWKIIATSWVSVCLMNLKKARTNGRIVTSTWTYGIFALRKTVTKSIDTISHVMSIIKATSVDRAEHTTITTKQFIYFWKLFFSSKKLVFTLIYGSPLAKLSSKLFRSICTKITLNFICSVFPMALKMPFKSVCCGSCKITANKNTNYEHHLHSRTHHRLFLPIETFGFESFCPMDINTKKYKPKTIHIKWNLPPAIFHDRTLIFRGYDTYFAILFDISKSRKFRLEFFSKKSLQKYFIHFSDEQRRKRINMKMWSIELKECSHNETQSELLNPKKIEAMWVSFSIIHRNYCVIRHNKTLLLHRWFDTTYCMFFSSFHAIVVWTDWTDLHALVLVK